MGEEVLFRVEVRQVGQECVLDLLRRVLVTFYEPSEVVPAEKDLTREEQTFSEVNQDGTQS